VNQKEPGDKPIFGLLSGRELFYFLFFIFVIATLVIYAWVLLPYQPSKPPAPEDPKVVQRREIINSVESSGGFFISETKVLLYDVYASPTNRPWSIYDTKSEQLSDGSYLTRKLEQAGPYRDAVTNPGWLSGWKGNCAFLTRSTNCESLIFRWSINDQRLQVFKWTNFSGGWKNLYPFNAIPVEDGWLSSPQFPDNKQMNFLATGSRIGPMSLGNPFKAILALASSWPYQDGLYVAGRNTNNNLAEVFVLGFANRALMFSNLSVKTPLAPVNFLAEPDPSGKRVIWIFERESSMGGKIHNLLPSFLASGFNPGPALSFYSSDLHATQFHFVCSVKGPLSYDFLWGFNGDSIWLPDPEKGIKQYQLK
jgi:hypothetical protein